MCGIIGVIDGSNTIDLSYIENMSRAIAHRGPDGEGFLFLNGSRLSFSSRFRDPGFNVSYALAHRRLSIVDLEGGIQPMSNEDETVWITYNGEIYNHLELREGLVKRGHVFRTDHSDTEVIIHAYEEWGIEGFDRLNGIFGFGIIDLRKKRLILARDHFGVKPVYYYHYNGSLIFSSEIKAILEYGGGIEKKVDLNALSDYLTFRYVPSPRTMFQNIYKIEAGGYLAFDLDRRQISSLGNYSTRTAGIDHRKGINEWMEDYQRNLEQAVIRQLLSDVEVGALLSGGLDSSAVCAIAAEHIDHPLRTYTVGFKDSPNENEIDEATEYAKYIGSTHTNVLIDEMDFINVLEEVAWFMDEPTATSSSIPLYYLTKAVKKDVKVVLTGQGADEPLGGYARYLGVHLYQKGFKHAAFLAPVLEHFPRNESLKRAFRSFSEPDTFERFMAVYCLFSPHQRKLLLKNPLPQESNPLIRKLFDQCSTIDDLGRMFYIDTRAWLPDDFLIYGDKATMINSIEARVPYLDKDFVHFVETIPSRFKVSWSLQRKFIHKKACRKWLPDFVTKRRKKGFGTPVDSWFRNELEGYVREQIVDGRLSRDLFNPAYIIEMLEKHKRGREDFRRQLFALLMLEKWAEAFKVGI